MSSKSGISHGKQDGGTWEIVKVVIQALLIALVIRTLFFQPFNIPSGSMIPTLRVGDYLFVNKLSYGYGPYSFNLAPSIFGTRLFKIGPFHWFDGRVIASKPERGDVVVFKLPRDNETDYIKRVVGLPGDRIQMKEGVLHVNDVAIERTKIDDYLDPDYGRDANPVPQFRETLDGETYNTLDLYAGTRADDTREFVVPADMYFVMGDNRDNSKDSRFPDVGMVPYDNLVGKATIIFFSHQKDESFWKVWRWPVAIRWSRLFNWVH